MYPYIQIPLSPPPFLNLDHLTPSSVSRQSSLLELSRNEDSWSKENNSDVCGVEGAPQKFLRMFCLSHENASSISASLWKYRCTLGNLNILEKKGVWFEIMSFLLEIVFIANKPRDFYFEKLSPMLMMQFTWGSHSVTPTQSLRRQNTGFSFFTMVIFFI